MNIKEDCRECGGPLLHRMEQEVTALDDMIIQQEQELHTDNAAGSHDVPVITLSDDNKKKKNSDDVMLTQAIICILLALAVFCIGFINSCFQQELLSLYREHMYAEPEPFIETFIQSVENWFRK